MPKINHTFQFKPLFLDRMKQLLPNKEDFDSYMEILKHDNVKSIRCNTLKINPLELKARLEKKGWKISQLWKNHPEVMIVENELLPGELGRSLEHLLGYYYVQELASMLPVIAMNPLPTEKVLDLCASPGSKTTQIASVLENSGLILANELNFGRIKILAANLERCGVMNAILTKKDGAVLCEKLAKMDFQFDKVLVDAPCSGEGTLRSTQKTSIMWSINSVKQLSGIQKKLVSSAIKVLRKNGILVYSTCTHAPEENEEIVDFILRNFPEMKIEHVNLPSEIKYRQGITSWNGKSYNNDVSKSARIYPHDNDTEGFFIAKFKKVK